MKLSKNYEELLKINIEEINWFPTVALMLTKSCGLECDFCCEPGIRVANNIEFQYEKIIEKLSKFGTKRVCLAGGDPILYKSLPNLLNITKAKGIYNLLLTADGLRLKKLLPNLIDNVDGFRLSIQGLGNDHDKCVNSNGSFEALLKSVEQIILNKKDLMVSTVVTNNNINSIHKIAEWCKKNSVQKYYLYGLLRSGQGEEYIKNFGRPTNEQFDKLIEELKNNYQDDNFKISCYDYNENGECILIYGNGDIFVAPYYNSPDFRLKIGNILTDEKGAIWSNFKADNSNLIGHKKHLKNAL